MPISVNNKPGGYLRTRPIEDGTQMRVRNALHQRLCATTPGQAALKLLPRLSLAKGQLENLRFAAAVHHDHRLLRGTLTKGALYLRDLGFYEHDEFARIHDAGAFFVSLLKENARPVIVKAFEGIRSSFSPFEQPLDGRFSYGPTVDVDAFFRLSERSERVFRVVQIEVPSEDRHGRPTATLRRVWFVTNLDRATWTPAAIGALYRLRYTCIERLFRSCKSLGRLAHLDSGRMPVLMTFVVSSWILQTLAARLTQQLVRRYQLGNVSGDRVMLILVESWNDILRSLLAPGDTYPDIWPCLLTQLLRHGKHPNGKQPQRILRVAEQLAEQSALLGRISVANA